MPALRESVQSGKLRLPRQNAHHGRTLIVTPRIRVQIVCEQDQSSRVGETLIYTPLHR